MKEVHEIWLRDPTHARDNRNRVIHFDGEQSTPG